MKPYLRVEGSKPQTWRKHLYHLEETPHTNPEHQYHTVRGENSLPLYLVLILPLYLVLIPWPTDPSLSTLSLQLSLPFSFILLIF